ncbi:MAG: hypothetical protein ACFFD4_05130 [Candidatus Odinarchaeota archaeon]
MNGNVRTPVNITVNEGAFGRSEQAPIDPLAEVFIVTLERFFIEKIALAGVVFPREDGNLII